MFPLLALFWMENVIIGALNAARMLAIDPGDVALWGAKLLMVPFFCVHYGMFTAVHGIFVFSMFGQYKMDGLQVLGPAARATADWNLWLPLGALAASHLFSFFWNFVHRGEYLRAGLQQQMFKPYGRVVVLHLAIPESRLGDSAQERRPRMVSMLPPVFMQAAKSSSANF